MSLGQRWAARSAALLRLPLSDLGSSLLLALWGLYFALFVTYAANWLFKQQLLQVRPVFLWGVSTLGFAVYTLAEGVGRVQAHRDWRRLLAGMNPVLASFGALVVISLLQAARPRAYWEGGLTQILLLVVDFGILLSGAFLSTSPLLRRHLPKAIDLGWLVLLVSIAVDVYQPGTLSKQLARAAGFAEVANNAATILVLLCCLRLHYRRLRGWDIVRLLLTAAGVVATLSRGGAVLFFLLLFAYCVSIAVRPDGTDGPVRMPVRKLVVAGLVMVSIVGVLALSVLALRHAPGMFGRYQAQQRLGMFLGQDILSKMDHRQDLIDDYLTLIGEQPIWGHGTAFSMSFEQRPHNVYMDLWVNLGLPGLFAYLCLLGVSFAIFWRAGFRAGLVLMLLVAASGMVDHTVVHDRAILLLWGCSLTQALLGAPRFPTVDAAPGPALVDSRPTPLVA